MRTEVAIINVFRIEAPEGTKVLNGDRAMDVDFCVNGEMFLVKDVLAHV